MKQIQSNLSVMILKQLLPWFQDDRAGGIGGCRILHARGCFVPAANTVRVLFQPLHGRGSTEGLGSAIISRKMKYWIHLCHIMWYPKEQRFRDCTFCSLAVFDMFGDILERGFENQGGSGKTMKIKCGSEQGLCCAGPGLHEHRGSLQLRIFYDSLGFNPFR